MTSIDNAVRRTFHFDVAAEDRAWGLAEALSSAGFVIVRGRPQPEPRSGWTVAASLVDLGCHERAYSMIHRRAIAIARDFGGRPAMQVHGCLYPARVASPIEFVREDARPDIPHVDLVPTPPPARLPRTPDGVVRRPPDLTGMDVIDWTAVEGPAGPVGGFPVLFRGFADAYADELSGDLWDEQWERMTSSIINSGTLYESTARSVPFIAELVRSGGDPRHRNELINFVTSIAAGEAESMLADADIAIIEGRLPRARKWAAQTHVAIGAEVRSLLEAWSGQPPAIKADLVRLAAMYPHQARWLEAEIADFVSTIPSDTQQAVAGHLALAILGDNEGEALRICQYVGQWDESLIMTGWDDRPMIDTQVRARYVLGMMEPQ